MTPDYRDKLRDASTFLRLHLGHLLCIGLAICTAGAPARAQTDINQTSSQQNPLKQSAAGTSLPVTEARTSEKPNTSTVVKWHGSVPITGGGFGTYPVPGTVGTPGSLGTGFRYDEDYSYLRDPAKRLDYTDPFKYIPLDPEGDIYLTFNGDARLKVDNLSAGNFGIPKSPITYNPKTGNYSGVHCVKCDNATGVYSRIDLGADLHITPYFRFYAEFLDGQVNQDAPSSSNAFSRNELILVQGFGEADAYAFGGKEGLQVGRQLVLFHWLALGSSIIPNVFAAEYDGARAFYDNGAFRTEIFYWNLVTPKLGGLEDYTNYTQSFWGSYNTFVLPQVKFLGETAKANLDVFYFNSRSGRPQGPGIADSSYAVYSRPNSVGVQTVTFLNGSDHRNTLGTDYYGTLGGWAFDYSVAGQVGTYIHRHVQGYYIGTKTGYTFTQLPWHPNPFLRLNIASGDFEQLGQSTFAVAQDSFITETNLINASAHLIVTPTKSFLMEGFASALFRYNQHDGITPGMFSGSTGNYGITAFVPGAYVGTLLDLRTNWAIVPHLSFSTEFAELVSGAVLHEVHAPNSLYLESQLEYKF